MAPVTTAIIGGFAGGIAKAIVDNASTAVSNYVKKVNEGRDRLVGEIAGAINETPPEQLSEPPPHMVEPIYRGLVLRDEHDLLTQMFRRLLRRAFNRQTQGDVLPSFAAIIPQLTPDEALILHTLKLNANLRIPNAYLNGYGYFPTEKLAHPERFIMNVKRLIRADLVAVVSKLPPVEIPGTPDIQVLDSFDPMRTSLERGTRPTQISFDGVSLEPTPTRTIALSEFGRLFAEACIPDELPQEPPAEQRVEIAVDQ